MTYTDGNPMTQIIYDGIMHTTFIDNVSIDTVIRDSDYIVNEHAYSNGGNYSKHIYL